MASKILIEIKNGNVISVLSSEPIRFVVINHDEPDHDRPPLIYENDITSNHIFELYHRIPEKSDLYHELKLISF